MAKDKNMDNQTTEDARVEEPAAVDTETTKEERREDRREEKRSNRRHFDVWSMFWGVILVGIGVMMLLGNYGLLEVDWANVWRLWPLFIIVAGFSILASSHWIWRILAFLAVLAALLGVFWLGTGHGMGWNGMTGMGTDETSVANSQRVTVGQSSSATSGEIELETGASKLNVTSHSNGSDLIDANLQGNWLTLNKDESITNTTQKVRLWTDGSHMWRGGSRNTWDVSVTESLPLDMRVKAGASDTNVDLANTRLRSFAISAGASRLDVKLGDKEAKQTVSVDSGASSITLRLPKDSGVSLKFDGGLNSKDLADLKSTGNGNYRSDNYDKAAKTIDITANAGVGSFTIVRY